MPTPMKKLAPWALAASTLLLAALLIAKCLAIWQSGAGYSRELAAQKLAELDWAFLLWLTSLLAALFSGPAPRRNAPKSSAACCPRVSCLRRIPYLTPVLYLLALILILTGIRNGGMWDVLVKAVNICTECIGLG